MLQAKKISLSIISSDERQMQSYNTSNIVFRTIPL